MGYTHIVFDIDGTLIDTEYEVLHSLQKTLNEVTNIAYDISDLKFALGITGEAALARLEIQDRTAALELWNNYIEEFHNTVKVFAGIESTLNSLAAAGYTLGIVTSETKEEYAKEFKRFQISALFKTIVCADDTTEHKPLAAPLKKYMELSDANCNEILYIGDSEYDMLCAENANIDFALAGWGAVNNKMVPKYRLEKPEDLYQILHRTKK